MGENGFLEGFMLGKDGGQNRDGAFGGGWVWIIFLFFLLCWGGWGRGFGGGYGGGSDSAGFQGLATRADISEGFAVNGLSNGISGLRDGQFGIQNTLCQGFNGVDRSISQLGYQMQNCCCETQRAIDGVNYNMATNSCNLQNTMNQNTRDIIDAQNANTQRIVDLMTQREITQLRTELQSAQLTLAQAQQTNNIVNALRPTPQPAYLTCSPYTTIPISGLNVGNTCGCYNA